jgi:hypothetical protein
MTGPAHPPYLFVFKREQADDPGVPLIHCHHAPQCAVTASAIVLPERRTPFAVSGSESLRPKHFSMATKSWSA